MIIRGRMIGAGYNSAGLQQLNSISPPLLSAYGPGTLFTTWSSQEEVAVGGDRRSHKIGLASEEWLFAYLSLCEYDLLRLYCPGLDSLATIFTQDMDTLLWVTVNTIMHWAIIGEDATFDGVSWRDVKITFTDFEEI